MSSGSDVEEFYDAEEASPDKAVRHRRPSKSPTVEQPEDLEKKNIETDKEPETALKSTDEVAAPTVDVEHNRDQNVALPSELQQDPGKRVKDIGKRRRRLEEARRKIQTEDNEESCEMSSVPGSQTSSLDGVWAAINSRPYATQEVKEETGSASTFSLGRIGHILGGGGGSGDLLSLNSLSSLDSRHSPCPAVTVTAPADDPEQRTVSRDEELELAAASSAREQSPPNMLQEPDLVASTKSGSAGEAGVAKVTPPPLPMLPPVAPPRRKRKNRATPPIKPTSLDTEGKGLNICQGIPSPASTIESITKEFEHSLDLPSAIRGQYVVKPQDEATTKAEGPSCEESHGRLVFYLSDEVLFTGDGSAIDPGLSKQLNMLVRTRTDSGKQLTDLEILEQVMVLNLDTGEKIPLSLAEDRLPRCINPLSLHIMRLTSEYVSNSSLEKEKESDEDNDDTKSKTSTMSVASGDSDSVRKKTTQIKRLINRTVEKTVSKIKSVADEVYHARHMDDILESSEEEPTTDHRQNIKFKSSGSHKGPYEFNNLKLVQDLSGEHTGAVWTMKFSYCGRLLATVGQDHIVRIWVLKDSYGYFNDMRQKYNTEAKISPTPSQESLASHQSTVEDSDKMSPDGESVVGEDAASIFATKPFCSYVGHTADLLDVSWSKNYFILSSSMDKTVRLWHISRKECLCCFQHIDFVTAIAFHPRDDRYFLSGSLDGKLRLWNIPDKKVALWNELDGQTKLITAASFCQNGKFAVVGTYDGRCIFYTTEQLKYYTQIHVRSTRGKNAKGRKISGIEPMPGEDKILVTSNDSRIRLYDLRDLSLSCKYKGYTNLSSQIRASFSHDGKCIVSGSENQYVYLWKTHHDYSKFSSARKDRNDYWEGLKAHNAVVTAAVFAPNPSVIFKQMDSQKAAAVAAALASAEPEPLEQGATAGGATSASKLSPPYDGSAEANVDRYVLVTADFAGGVKVFVNRSRAVVAKPATPLPPQ